MSSFPPTTRLHTHHDSEFSADVLMLRNSTVTGIAEKISENFVAIMNEVTNFKLNQGSEDGKKEKSRQPTVKFKKFRREISTLNS
jgi:hypothetical protein